MIIHLVRNNDRELARVTYQKYTESVRKIIKNTGWILWARFIKVGEEK